MKNSNMANKLEKAKMFNNISFMTAESTEYTNSIY